MQQPWGPATLFRYASLVAAVFLFSHAAQAATDLYVVLKLAEPAAITGTFGFARPQSGVEFVSGTPTLTKLLASNECKANAAGLARCHLIETVGRRDDQPCVAVILDSSKTKVELSDFRIRRAGTEEAAVRKAFFGSNIYNTLYFQQRLVNPFRTITVIDEFVFTDGESWKDNYLGSKCRD